MAVQVEIHAFIGGYIRTVKERLIQTTDEREMGRPHWIPIPFYVVRHGSSLVAFDTGMNERCARDPEGHLGKDILAVPIVPEMKPEEAFDKQLKSRLGIEPRDLNGLILSHGHLDHAGSVHVFADTEVPIFVQRSELQVIEEGQIGYMPADYGDLKRLHFVPVDGVLDVFGDGTVVAFPMPGHTPGMMSLMVTVTDGRRYVLTSDALDSIEQLEKRILPWVAWDESKVVQVFNVLSLLRLAGAEIVPEHDPFYWKNRPLAPHPFE
ncbi:MAG: N-acyl homoserine lactonase family protein [bacterium]